MNLTLLFTDYTLRTVLLGCLVLGICSGILGSFAVLHRQGLMGDALAHAALPGICVAFMLSGSRTPLVLMAGASLSAGLAGLAILALTARLKVDTGSALAAVLTSFFGLGAILLKQAQKGSAASAGLDQMLFGQAASLVEDQVIWMALLGGLAVGAALLLHRPYRTLAFDPQFAASTIVPSRWIEGIFSLLLILGIVIGLRTVGVVLMSAMLVAPAAAARQWCRTFNSLLWVAAGIGALCAAFGAAGAIVIPQAPTGPLVVICLALAVIASLVLGKERGWIRTLSTGAKSREGRA